MTSSDTYPYLSRKCRYCGRTFVAQEPEYDGTKFRAMDSRGRMQTIRSKTADYVPAYIMRTIHERTCEAR